MARSWHFVALAAAALGKGWAEDAASAPLEAEEEVQVVVGADGEPLLDGKALADVAADEDRSALEAEEGDEDGEEDDDDEGEDEHDGNEHDGDEEDEDEDEDEDEADEPLEGGEAAGAGVPMEARSGNFTVVKCSTTAGPLTIHVFRDWAPHGAERFLDMVRSGFFSTKVGLFRAVKGFLCQTGVAGDPAVQEAWNKKGTIEDDEQWLDLSVPRAMKRGYLSFAGSGKNSRGVEFFFAFRDLGLGKSRWEVPFGTLVGKESFETMDHWYTGYGDIKAFGGRAPEQQELYRRGVAYLESDFPELDYILSCEASPGSTSA